MLARGACVEAGHDQAWSIGLPHPYRRTERLGQIRLRDQALSTSGSATQFFEHNGRRLGHILTDPRSGLPVEGVLSATALAPTAAEADALSTAFYVLGPQAVDEYCARRPDVGAVLVCPAARSPGIEVHTFGMAAESLLHRPVGTKLRRRTVVRAVTEGSPNTALKGLAKTGDGGHHECQFHPHSYPD